MKNRRKKAFTLAETLTTLMIIGFIAALVIPVFFSETSSKLLTQQKKTFESKFKDSLHVMQAKGALSKGYSTTAEFMEDLSKYANIAKICNCNQLEDCFAEKVMESKSEIKFQTSDIDNSTDMGADFNSDINTFVMNNGTHIMLAYRPNCVITNRYDVTYNVTECIAMIYDVNGKEGPNLIGEDISTINLGTDNMGIDELETFFTEGHCGDANDCWAYAQEKCSQDGKHLPDLSEMQQIAAKLYGTNSGSINMSGATNGLSVSDKNLWAKLKSPAGGYNYWTRNESSPTAAKTTFFNTNSVTIDNGDKTKSNKFRAFCIK